MTAGHKEADFACRGGGRSEISLVGSPQMKPPSSAFRSQPTSTDRVASALFFKCRRSIGRRLFRPTDSMLNGGSCLDQSYQRLLNRLYPLMSSHRIFSVFDRSG